MAEPLKGALEVSETTVCVEFQVSDGHVFADLALPNVDELKIKAALVGAILRASKEHGFSQSETAKRAGIPQPRLSNLSRGKVEGVSTDKLIAAVARLGGRVRIVVEEHPEPAYAGRVDVEMA